MHEEEATKVRHQRSASRTGRLAGGGPTRVKICARRAGSDTSGSGCVQVVSSVAGQSLCVGTREGALMTRNARGGRLVSEESASSMN